MWAPTHPGFGRSGDAEWMEGIDDLARFYLWFIDAAGLGRPHLLGHSIGGWTAAEMAAMSPRSIDRLVLVAPVGLKPETGEILDVFYHSPAQLLGMTVHDPKTIPEWDALFGRPLTPAEAEIAERNREMTARLTWKPYMHNPRLARFLPRVTNPTLDRLGPRGPHRARRVRRAVPAAPAECHADRARAVWPPPADRAARCLRAPGHRFPGRTRPAMKLYYFSEMPHHEFPDEEGDKYPSLRLEFPNRFFSPEKARANYQRYLDEYELADQVGFDGLMLNEHHSTPSCVNVGVNMTAAILGRTTKRAKLLLLGNILPIEDNPVRLAEQIAMADLISGGRVLSGFVRGVGVETWWSNTNPVHNRERFEECHDLILKCWTTPGPFRWEGRQYHFRHVNPWCLPLQKPHPPVWVPGTASPETAIWAGRRGYTYVPFLVPFDVARELFDYYRQGAAEAGPGGDRRQPRLPDLRRHRGHQGQGPGGRPAFRLAHGPDPARPRRVLLPGRHALARRAAVRHAGAPALAGVDELRRAGERALHHRRHP